MSTFNSLNLADDAYNFKCRKFYLFYFYLSIFVFLNKP